MSDAEDNRTLVSVRGVNVFYRDIHAAKDINFDIELGKVTALVGPSGCGKSTIMKAIPRLHDNTLHCRIEGCIKYKGEDVYSPSTNVHQLRRKLVYIDHNPRVFSTSIYENVSVGARYWGVTYSSADLDVHVERCLRTAALWDEVKDRLGSNATELSAGQKQRLAIARALSVKPEALLLDEPTANVDPISAAKLEESIDEMRVKDMAIFMITHSMAEAARLSQTSIMVHLGNAVEVAKTEIFFTNPEDSRTQGYITGRFG